MSQFARGLGRDFQHEDVFHMSIVLNDFIRLVGPNVLRRSPGNIWPNGQV